MRKLPVSRARRSRCRAFGRDATAINIAVSGGTATALLSRVAAVHSDNGIVANGVLGAFQSLNVSVVDSVIANNTNIGILSLFTQFCPIVMLRNSTVSNNGVGLETSGDDSAIIRVAHSTITGNTFGLSPNDGSIFSYGDNNLDGNTSGNAATNGAFTTPNAALR